MLVGCQPSQTLIMRLTKRSNEQMAAKIATPIKDRWSVGSWSQFCDDADWDSADDEELKAEIKRILDEN